MIIIFPLPRWSFVSNFPDIWFGSQPGTREGKPRAVPGSLRTGVIPSWGPGGKVLFPITNSSRKERDTALKAHARRVDCHLVAGVIDIGFTDDGWRAHICPDFGTPPCLLRMTCCALVRRRLRAHVSICRLLLNEQVVPIHGLQRNMQHTDLNLSGIGLRADADPSTTGRGAFIRMVRSSICVTGSRSYTDPWHLNAECDRCHPDTD